MANFEVGFLVFQSYQNQHFINCEQISGNSFLLKKTRMLIMCSFKRKVRTYLESVQRYIQKVYQNNLYIQPYNYFI